MQIIIFGRHCPGTSCETRLVVNMMGVYFAPEGEKWFLDQITQRQNSLVLLYIFPLRCRQE